MRLVYDAIQQVAASNINVLIRARAARARSGCTRHCCAQPQATKPFIRLNCAALPENLIESELFGSERGAFTGATEARPGHIELADGGTLFLDEIATLTLPLQTKLLRVLEDHHVQRLAGARCARLISGSSPPPMNRWKRWPGRGASAKPLLSDSRYSIHLPPLGSESQIFPCLRAFSSSSLRGNGMLLKRFTADALSALEEHTWPGNVRELENLIQRLIVTTRGDEIAASDLRLVCWLKALPRRRQFCSLRTAPTLTNRFARLRRHC